MTEIFGALLLCVWWIVAVSLLTADGAVASTIQGRNVCNGEGAEHSFLGNNLYISLWVGMYSSVKIALKWKAAQAMGVVAPKTAEAMEENGLRSSK